MDPVAQGAAAAGPLDHFRAEVGQQAAGSPPGDDDGEIQDFQSLEGSRGLGQRITSFTLPV